MPLKFVYYGDPILRRHCREITEVTEEIKELARNMIEMMRIHNGVGIAGPQVGIDLRIFISALDECDNNGYAVLSKPEVYINPKIIEYSDEEEIHSEGCLSIPGVYEEISRPIRVTVEALDIEGNPFQIKATGWKAWNLLHENDHLNGVLVIDRVGKLRRRQLEPALKKIKKKYSKK